MKNILNLLKRHWMLVFLLLVIFILRMPSLFEPNRYADEDIYLTLGLGVRKGLVLYRDIHDNKPPLLYLVAAIAGNIFWFKFILLIAHAVGVVFFWKLADLVFEKRRLLVLTSSSIFGILSTLPWLEGNIANGENFMIVPGIIGAYLLYGTVVKPSSFARTKIYALIGFCFSIAFLFKIPIAFDLVGLLLFWWLFAKDHLSLREKVADLFSSKLWLMVGCFALPIVVSIFYYTSRGAFEPYVRSALLQNIGYLSSWQGSEGGLLQNPLVFRGIVVLGISGLILFSWTRIPLQSRFVLLWTTFSMYGALLSSRPYPHYLLEPLVPISFLIPLFFYHIYERKFLAVSFSLGMFILLFLAYVDMDFWYYRSIPYYKNIIDYISGNKSKKEYINFWSGASRNYEVAEYIRERSNVDDLIFVWGTEPAIYVLANRLPVGRYTVAYHVVDFNAYDETVTAIGIRTAKYIVMMENNPPFDKLDIVLEENYFLENRVDEADIYRRL